MPNSRRRPHPKGTKWAPAGVRYWVDRMELDVGSDVEGDHRREKIDQELDKWLEEIGDKKPHELNWNASLR